MEAGLQRFYAMVMNVHNAAHLCVDMQTIFAPGNLWATPWMERVTPNIVRLTEKYPARTVFTRFITPVHAEDRPGAWQTYFRKWHQATLAELPLTQLELIPELARFAPPATVMDKPGYSAFTASNLATFLHAKGICTVIVSGAETDVCVLATVLSAVDIGFYVVLAEDAVCSSSDEGHDALMKMYHQRFSHQIRPLPTSTILELWQEV